MEEFARLEPLGKEFFNNDGVYGILLYKSVEQFGLGDLGLF
jgi:replication initiation and membrane attachment protein DnaB